MSNVRPFERADIPQVTRLHPRAFEDSSHPPEDYFEEFFFSAPLIDPEIRSLVCENGDGEIIGFLGVMPRRYSWRAKSIRAAVTAHLMIDPSVRSTRAALSLFKNFLSGPQDLSIADAVNTDGRTVWQAFKGQVVWPYNLHWTRTFQPSPSGHMRSLSRGSPVLRAATFAARPIWPLLDRAATRVWQRRHRLAAPAVSATETDAKVIVPGLNEVVGDGVLRPDYTSETLAWLLNRAAAKSVHGRLHTVAVHDDEGELIGWYIYYLKPRQIAVVMQFAAKPAAVNQVLDSLLLHAWQGEAVAVSGRLEPAIMSALSTRSDMSYHLSEYWMMVHARDPELLAAIHRGEAMLSRLDGEWSLAYHGEPIE